MSFFKKLTVLPKRQSSRTGRNSKEKNERPADNQHRTGFDFQSKGNGEASAVPKTTTSKESFDPWLEAQQLLRKDRTLNKIWEESMHILRSHLGLKYDDNAGGPRLNNLRTFLDLTTQRLDDKKWTVQDDIGQSDTRGRLTKVCQNVLLIKDVINMAASASPPAAIACAGITVGLLLFIQAMVQHEILLQGLETISSLLPRLHIIERHFLHRDAGLSTDMSEALRKNIIQLYSKVLEFQSRAICYLGKRTAKQFVTDMLKQDGWDGILQDIERYNTFVKDTTSSAHVFEVERKLEAHQNTLRQMQVWQTTSTKDRKKADLFQRLYTCPYKDRKDRNNKRVPGTCEWFTNHPQFTKWNQSRNSELLWVSADPGCGKSVLTRYLADEYLPSGVRTVCYFFFKDDYADQKRATNALASILRQLLIAQPHLVQDSLLDKSETSGDQLVESFNELWNILVHVTADENTGEVICLLDALDECQEDDRKMLIQAIETLFLKDLGKRNLKFLMTSRPYDYIRRDFFRLEKNLPTIRLSGENEENIEKISSEIDQVIKERVRDIGERNLLQPNECDFIIELLTSVPNRTYLWVSLTLDVVEKMPGFSRGNVRRVVHGIPKNIDAAYTRMLNQSPDYATARKLLHIVTAAERPLTLEEISLSLAIHAEDQSVNDMRNEIQTDERTQIMIRDLCGLFLAMVDGKVYLFHQTAKEFLVRDPARGDTGASTWKHSLHPGESHYILAGICTLYLSQIPIYKTFPGFMDYAANNWAVHFRRASVSSKDSTAQRGRTLCQQGSKVCKDWTAIYKRNRSEFPDSHDILMASYLGLAAVVKILRDAGEVDVESEDSKYGQTPLSWAARNGHVGVIKLLLETGEVDVESKDSQSGRTPLSWAAGNGHEGVVKLLLETEEADVESKTLSGLTPLIWAAENGHAGVVKLLLETGEVDIEAKDFIEWS
ncbi:ankyrin repeat protein [Aspergillus insuetus]